MSHGTIFSDNKIGTFSGGWKATFQSRKKCLPKVSSTICWSLLLLAKFDPIFSQTFVFVDEGENFNNWKCVHKCGNLFSGFSHQNWGVKINKLFLTTTTTLWTFCKVGKANIGHVHLWRIFLLMNHWWRIENGTWPLIAFTFCFFRWVFHKGWSSWVIFVEKRLFFTTCQAKNSASQRMASFQPSGQSWSHFSFYASSFHWVELALQPGGICGI